MDDIDKKILELLENDARIPLKQLAQNVCLSSPAVSARIDRLKQSGILLEYKTVLNPQKLGYEITAYINLSMPPEKRDEFLTFAESCANITECYHVTGAYSMLMKVHFSGTQALNDFVCKAQTYGKTQTQIVFSTPIPVRGIKLTSLS